MAEEKLTLRLSGENAASAEAIGSTLSAMDELFKAVAEEMGMDPSEVRLAVGSMGWICDGCERPRPDDHDDWIKRDGLDFCPDCQPESERAERSE